MVNEKNIDPKKIIIMIIAIILALILKNFIIGTLCIEEYQIAECPNNLNLSSYCIQAENKEDANNKIKAILEENNFNLSNYEIIIESNNIKINEKEIKKINEKEKAGTEKQETEEINTIQDNNLEIKNESVEFNNNEVIKRNIPIEIPELIDIHFNDEKINYTLTIQLYKDDEVKLTFVEIQNAIDNNYQDENIKWIIKDEDGNTLTGEEKIQVDIVRKEGKRIIDLYVEIIKEEQEEGGTITNADIEELKKIDICICMLLAIMFIYNFTSLLFKRH